MRYTNPSIIEALCEFQFNGESDWDPTAYGLFYAEIKHDFPNSERRDVLAATSSQTPAGVEHQFSPQPRMWFGTAEKNRIVQLGERLLAVNALKPYPGWDRLRELVLTAGEAYHAVVPGATVARTSVRYVDRLEFPSAGFRLGDWIKCDGEYFSRQLADCTSMAYSRIAQPIGDQEHFLLSLTLEPAASGSISLTLDTELFCERPFPSVKATTDLLNLFHTKIVSAFEACITDKTRASLVPESGGAT